MHGLCVFVSVRLSVPVSAYPPALLFYRVEEDVGECPSQSPGGLRGDGETLREILAEEWIDAGNLWSFLLRRETTGSRPVRGQLITVTCGQTHDGWPSLVVGGRGGSRQTDREPRKSRLGETDRQAEAMDGDFESRYFHN